MELIRWRITQWKGRKLALKLITFDNDPNANCEEDNEVCYELYYFELIYTLKTLLNNVQSKSCEWKSEKMKISKSKLQLLKGAYFSQREWKSEKMKIWFY